tara:strand:- start:455 stop:697 length:243 start_codon:yes stop_codon:yes gene_type:complete
MTEYEDRVQRQKELLKAEEWGKRVKYIHASDGIIETAFNNGDIKYVENKPGGKTTWHRETKTNNSLAEDFKRWLADQRIF